MSVNLSSYLAAAQVAGPGMLARAQGKANGAFSASLQDAFDAVSISVQEARTALNGGQAQAVVSGLESSLGGLEALVAQFAQAYGGQNSAALVAPSSPLAVNAAAGQRAVRLAGSDAAEMLAGAGAGAKPAQAAVESTRDAAEPWVIAALNKAIDQCKVNGYDPAQSHAVNTLRGYFSGDAQAKSQAMHSISSSMLAAGGAYETFDGGVHTIAGGAPPAGMNTTMPTFDTAYDKDWSRPSLYDQINSSLGWNADANQEGRNYADPANRDSALNRKLSDAEVQAFQSGQLTPELQALVNQYRGPG